MIDIGLRVVHGLDALWVLPACFRLTSFRHPCTYQMLNHAISRNRPTNYKPNAQIVQCGFDSCKAMTLTTAGESCVYVGTIQCTNPHLNATSLSSFGAFVVLVSLILYK